MNENPEELAWVSLAAHLNLKVIAPYRITIEGQDIRGTALVEGFGSALGTVVFQIRRPRGLCAR